jgi:hypothetical protein
MTTAVCHSAASQGPLVAVGAFERDVELWDVQTARRVGAFSSVLDFGGRRLALDAAGTTCFSVVAGHHRSTPVLARGGAVSGALGSCYGSALRRTFA